MENNNIIHLLATWEVQEGQMARVLGFLRTVKSESLKESGNLFYTIQRSNSNSNTLILFEGYKSAKAIEEHRNTTHFKELVLGSIVPLLSNREIVLATPIE